MILRIVVLSIFQLFLIASLIAMFLFVLDTEQIPRHTVVEWDQVSFLQNEYEEIFTVEITVGLVDSETGQEIAGNTYVVDGVDEKLLSANLAEFTTEFPLEMGYSLIARSSGYEDTRIQLDNLDVSSGELYILIELEPLHEIEELPLT